MIELILYYSIFSSTEIIIFKKNIIVVISGFCHSLLGFFNFQVVKPQNNYLLSVIIKLNG